MNSGLNAETANCFSILPFCFFGRLTDYFLGRTALFQKTDPINARNRFTFSDVMLLLANALEATCQPLNALMIASLAEYY
jgi:hypothetical protein